MTTAEIIVLAVIVLIVIVVIIAVIKDRKNGGSNFLWYDLDPLEDFWDND